MSSEDHIINVFLFYFTWPDDNLISSVKRLGDSVDDFSVARFVIINPNIISPTKRPNINILAAHSNRVLHEGGIERPFNDVDRFCFIDFI